MDLQKLSGLLLASGNGGKLREIQRMTGHLGVHWQNLKDVPALVMPEETGATFEENALLKAGSAYTQSGLPSLAEDSGLCVSYLDGAPGIYSARFSGAHGNDEANNDTLLLKLEGVEEKERGAYYQCSMAFAFPADTGPSTVPLPPESRLVKESPYLPSGVWAWVTQGRVHGSILEERRGTGGFGYDPLFFYPDFNASFGETPAADKNQISHRAQAVSRLVAWFEAGAQRELSSLTS